MGGCFSDVRGGMEAVGAGRSRGSAAAAAQSGGPNDAVDYFFQATGQRGLYTPVENYASFCELREGMFALR